MSNYVCHAIAPRQPSFVRRLLALAPLLLGICGAPAVAAADGAYKDGYYSANDGVKLHYLEVGSGEPLVLIPGWSQTALEWKFQLDEFGKHYHVYALDMRGHGKSEKPDHGYRIARFAADLNDFLDAEKLDHVILDGHSMGNSVIWSYFELYGQGRVKKLVLTDQMAAIVANPAWSEEEKKNFGSILNADQVQPLDNALAGPDGAKTSAAFLHSMFAKDYPQADFDWALSENMQLPRKYAADLLYDHAFKNWSDVIRRIHVPTLVIGAKASNVPWTAMVWIGSQIKGAQTVIFEENEGGNHFMFLENPTKYNEVVEDFLAN
jgi:non-heme chloroperoxidase